jgi:hypothetical protein
MTTVHTKRSERTIETGDNPVDEEVGATRRELRGTDPILDSTAYGGAWFGEPHEREPHEATTPTHANQQPEEGSRAKSKE